MAVPEGSTTEVTAPAPKSEPVRIPVDDAGNPLPVKSFTDLVQRNYPTDIIAPDKSLPEAGAIAWTSTKLLKDEQGLIVMVEELNITARSSLPTLALENLLKTLAHIESLGIRVKVEQAPIKVALHQPMTQAAKALGGQEVPQGKPVASQPVTQPQPKPAQPHVNAEGGGTARIVKIVSKPLAGNKYLLEFHEAGHPKYPDYSTYKSGIELDAALAILNASGYEFTADMLNPTQAVAFDVNCELSWKYSNAVKKDGTHYKNFVQLYPVGG